MTGTPLLNSTQNWQIWVSDSTSSVTGTYPLSILIDTDGDRTPDSLDVDDDNDGVPDSQDSCVLSLKFLNRFVGMPDSDGDGYSNQGDAFPNEGSQYADVDSDGFGDNASGTFRCLVLQHTEVRPGGEFGCPDGDGDGWATSPTPSPKTYLNGTTPTMTAMVTPLSGSKAMRVRRRQAIQALIGLDALTPMVTAPRI